MVSTDYLYEQDVIKCIKIFKKQYKIKISIRAHIWYITESDKYIRKKTSTKQTKGWRGDKHNNQLKMWHIMLMFQEASIFLWINPGKTRTIIKFPVLIRACGAIEPCIFVAFLIVFPTAVYYFHPTKERTIFIHNMESNMIIRRKDI